MAEFIAARLWIPEDVGGAGNEARISSWLARFPGVGVGRPSGGGARQLGHDDRSPCRRALLKHRTGSLVPGDQLSIVSIGRAAVRIGSTGLDAQKAGSQVSVPVKSLKVSGK